LGCRWAAVPGVAAACVFTAQTAEAFDENVGGCPHAFELGDGGLQDVHFALGFFAQAFDAAGLEEGDEGGAGVPAGDGHQEAGVASAQDVS
jgi:hypothetical protein